LTLFLCSMAAAIALVPLCKRIAHRLGFVAQPRPDRWHQQPTALLGGVAFALPVVAGMALVGGMPHLLVFIFCATAIALVGLTDDVMSLKPATKLVAEIALASVFLAAGYRLHWVESMSLDSMLTILWVVGITNAFNLLDNMDGLCGGIALIAGTAFLMSRPEAAAGSAAYYEAQYLTLLLGAVAGFLFYNIHPASIFMGDAGSLFLGFSLAALTLGTAPERPGEPSLLSVIGVPVMVLSIPILDTALVALSRWFSGRSASTGGRDHSSHRLVAIGLSEPRAVAVLWSLAAIAGVTGYFVRSLDISWSLLLIASLLLAMTVFTVYLGNVRIYGDADVSMLRRRGVTPLVVDFMHKRRVAEVLLDLCVVSLGYYAAYRLRFEGEQFEQHFSEFLGTLPTVIACQLIALFVVGAYRGVWNLFSLIDTVVFGKGVLLGTFAALAVVLSLDGTEEYSRTVFVIYAALAFLLLGATRASFRLISEFASRRRPGERLVIYGAGNAGAVALRAIRANGRAPYRMIGYIDDDAGSHKIRVHGYPILGGFATLEQMLAQRRVDTVLLSRDIDPEKYAALRSLVAQHACRLIHVRLTIEEVETSTDGALQPATQLTAR
jgi:UDP-GlcNAc:undecaprenyl-phosphate GlcNAc-1-phosphate transferase